MSHHTHPAETARKLPTVLNVQQQETVIWTAIAIWMAANGKHPPVQERNRILALLREFGSVTLPDQQARMLVDNAAMEWGTLLDLAPWA